MGMGQGHVCAGWSDSVHAFSVCGLLPLHVCAGQRTSCSVSVGVFSCFMLPPSGVVHSGIACAVLWWCTCNVFQMNVLRIWQPFTQCCWTAELLCFLHEGMGNNIHWETCLQITSLRQWGNRGPVGWPSIKSLDRLRQAFPYASNFRDLAQPCPTR